MRAPLVARPTTTVTVVLRCLACAQHTLIDVATRDQWAALTNEERDRVDSFVSQHAAVQIAQGFT